MFSTSFTPARCPTHKVRHDACPANCIDSMRMRTRAAEKIANAGIDATTSPSNSPKPKSPRVARAVGGFAKKFRKAIYQPAGAKHLSPDIPTLVSACVEPAGTRPVQNFTSRLASVLGHATAKASYSDASTSTAASVSGLTKVDGDTASLGSAFSFQTVRVSSIGTSEDQSDTEVDPTVSTASTVTKDGEETVMMLAYADLPRITRIRGKWSRLFKRGEKRHTPIAIQLTFEVETRFI